MLNPLHQFMFQILASVLKLNYFTNVSKALETPNWLVVFTISTQQ